MMDNIRPTINSALRKHLLRISSSVNMYDYDDYYDDVNVSEAWRNYYRDLYGDYDDYNDNYDDDYDVESGYKDIYFYDDIIETESLSDATEHFYSLKEFSDYCDVNGINVSKKELSMLKYRRVSHCCLDPQALESGNWELLSDESYGGLYWECVESID